MSIAVLGAACRSTGGETRWDRHFDTDVWSSGFSYSIERPEQFMPEVFLFTVTPIIATFDSDISEDSFHQYVTGGNTFSGDAIAIGLGVVAMGTGGVEAWRGDGGRSVEVAFESLVATEAATQVIKTLTHRERPDGSSNDSFPSGHSSFSFAAATFLARRIDDTHEGPYDKLGYLLYLPATYVGISRLEGQRHYLSDVTAGAFLGILLTNWIYNAHYGDAASARPGIYTEPERATWSLEPVIDDERLGVSLALSF